MGTAGWFYPNIVEKRKKKSAKDQRWTGPPALPYTGQAKEPTLKSLKKKKYEIGEETNVIMTHEVRDSLNGAPPDKAG